MNTEIWFNTRTIEPIKICNLKDKKDLTKVWEVRVDRETCLGNPYELKTEDRRNIVCDNYYYYFHKKVLNDEEMINEIDRLIKIYNVYGKLHLYCWCSPKRCHAETIKDYIERKVNGP